MEENLQKRKRSRAIIYKDGSIVAMYREFNGRKYFTFPGGGMENDETEEECVKREVFEEFGLTVEPLKKVYTYENERSIEHFYICKWISGEVGDGAGEEYQPDNKNGLYIQTLIEIDDIPKLPLMPPEVAKVFIKDYRKNGEGLRDNILKIDGSLN